MCTNCNFKTNWSNEYKELFKSSELHYQYKSKSEELFLWTHLETFLNKYSNLFEKASLILKGDAYFKYSKELTPDFALEFLNLKSIPFRTEEELKKAEMNLLHLLDGDKELYNFLISRELDYKVYQNLKDELIDLEKKGAKNPIPCPNCGFPNLVYTPEAHIQVKVYKTIL